MCEDVIATKNRRSGREKAEISLDTEPSYNGKHLCRSIEPEDLACERRKCELA